MNSINYIIVNGTSNVIFIIRINIDIIKELNPIRIRVK